MKMNRIISKILVAALIIATVLSFASCSLFGGGALKLESFNVDRASVKTNYLVGEEIDFSGIKATVKYSDESLNTVYTYDDLTITYPDDITATVGDKEVSVSFDDPHLGVKQETKVPIKVTAEPIEETPDPELIVGFEKPANLTAFDSANSGAGKSTYGDASFSGEFSIGGLKYSIGNNNPFIFLPDVSVLGDNDEVGKLDAFFSNVEISILVDDTYVALTAAKGEGNVVTFSNGDTLIATVDTYNCSYQFSEDAAGEQVKISVLPSEEHYIFSDVNPVVLVAKVINAYNVYEAWELALIDNDTNPERGYKLDDANIWEAFKTEKGILNVDIAGIVIHNDLFVTENDVPAAFFLTTEKDTVYTNSATGAEEIIPAGTKYLLDWAEIYRRVLAPKETFVIEGNLFTIDLSGFPIVASPAVFGAEGNDDDYGSDFSNATFFKFLSTEKVDEADYSNVSINNVSLIGNAARDTKVDADGALASAGGLIFLKAYNYAGVTCNNVIGNSFFITYFTEQGSIITANDVKCYDSYQNAIFVWGASKVYLNNAFLNGAGGPVVICSSPEDASTKIYAAPTFVANNTIIETHLSGEEIWFTAVNANAIVSQIKGLGAGLAGAGLGNFVDNNGQMNIQGLIMAEGSDAASIIGGFGASGSISIGTDGMSRLPDNVLWQTINQLYAYNNALIQAPFLTVYDDTGVPYTVFFNGTTFCDLAGNALGTDASHMAILAAFQAADSITLTQGGLSVVFEFYH